MGKTSTRTIIGMAAVVTLGLAACGSDSSDTATDTAGDTASGQSGVDAAAVDRPTIAVTTNLLGDVVQRAVGDAAEVITIMPVGADPHDFQASAQEVNAMNTADALIVNGADFEEGLLDVIDGATDEGVPTFEAISVVDTIEFGEGGHDHDDHEGEEHSDEDKDEDHDHEGEEHSDEEHADEDEDHDHEGEEHSDEEHADEDEDDHSDEEHDHGDEEHSDDDHGDEDGHDGHDHEGADPHFFTDPMRMAEAVEGIVDFLTAELTFADPAAVEASADAYIAELTALDAEVTELVEGIPEANRILVTNHEVFGYFADRYEFEVVGVVIPGGGTTDAASAGELAELADVIRDEGVAAIFSDTSSSDELVKTLADEVGGVGVVELFTESLGDADSDGATYLDMVRANGQRIADALA